jgi:hypothetical protein
MGGNKMEYDIAVEDFILKNKNMQDSQLMIALANQFGGNPSAYYADIHGRKLEHDSDWKHPLGGLL